MLLIYVAIGIIAAVITGWFVYQNRMEYWETQARSAFRVALGKELQKRNEVDVYFSSSGNIRLPYSLSISTFIGSFLMSMESSGNLIFPDELKYTSTSFL